jgi:hypothetical protein
MIVIGVSRRTGAHLAGPFLGPALGAAVAIAAGSGLRLILGKTLAATGAASAISVAVFVTVLRLASPRSLRDTLRTLRGALRLLLTRAHVAVAAGG